MRNVTGNMCFILVALQMLVHDPHWNNLALRASRLCQCDNCALCFLHHTVRCSFGRRFNHKFDQNHKWLQKVLMLKLAPHVKEEQRRLNAEIQVWFCQIRA